MASENLTDRRIRSLEPPESGRLELWDSSEPGLILRVTPAGAKSWALQFKTSDYDGAGRRKTRKLTLGPYRGDGKNSAALSLADARKAARVAKGAVAKGEDPAMVKILARGERQETGRRNNAATLAEAVERFVELDERSPSKWRSYERPRILRSELASALPSKGVGEVTTQDLLRLQNGIRIRPAPIYANRFAQVVRVFFEWAAATYEISDPSRPLRLVTNEADYQRDRFLGQTELHTVYWGAGCLPHYARDFVRVLMLTPQRVSAVAGMKFSQIDQNGIWRVPRLQKKSKGGDQLLPLSGFARYIIEARRASGSNFDHVFCSGRGGDVHLQGMSKFKASLDKHLGDAVAPWRYHDFRRSFATFAATAGVDRETVRRALDHGMNARDALLSIYDRYDRLDEQRAALDQYARFVVLS
ncbi:tyrosine-type recombinase/integrase [Hyphococcus sp.]|uniref:tyrosine-type recombinase/integrase n=1 Tax=Hyphococcus sp. TaxID=2038636 RepID=UPI0035C74DCE